jgi:hypothetical protein
MGTRRKWLIGGIVPVLLLAAIVPAALAARQGGGGQPTLCTRNQLNVRQLGQEGHGGGYGTRVQLFSFFNHTKMECSMHGYPVLQMYGKRGRPIPTTTKDELPPGPHLFALDQGDSTTFSVSYRDVKRGAQPCPSSFVLRITPPHTNASLFIPARLTACIGVIKVSAVTQSRPI